MRIRALFNILLLIALSGLGSACSGEQTSSPPDDSIAAILKAYPDLENKKHTTFKVKRVVDGDTFETESGQKVRLIGVNCPESIGKVEFYGKEASNFSRERLTGKKVHMFQDAGEKDKYGRLLRYVFIENENTMYNETLLIEGYANTMTVPPNVMFSKKFVQLESEARKDNKGLWGTQPTRDRSSGANCSNPEIKGNINSKNEKIYHIPSGRYYNETKAEEMFCTEEEALAAGYRKAKE